MLEASSDDFEVVEEPWVFVEQEMRIRQPNPTQDMDEGRQRRGKPKKQEQSTPLVNLEKDVESRSYQVGQGTFTEKKRGYLFTHAVNLHEGQRKEETFTTGVYEVRYVSCKKCKTQMGWRYLKSDNELGVSKINKYCLGRYLLRSPEESRASKK